MHKFIKSLGKHTHKIIQFWNKTISFILRNCKKEKKKKGDKIYRATPFDILKLLKV